MTDINCKCINKKVAAIILVAGLLISGGVIFLINNRDVKDVEDVVLEQVISAEEAGEKVLSVINQHMLAPGMTASLVKVATERGLHKIIVDVQGQEVSIHLTKDGALLFPEAVDLEVLVAVPTPEPEKSTECEKFQAELTPERKVKIAQCLAERGYKVYYADWCPFCVRQKEMFGDAAKYLYGFDCYDPEGERGNIAKCPDLRGVPAWRDREGNQLKHNGQIVDGMIQIRILVEVSGCDF